MDVFDEVGTTMADILRTLFHISETFRETFLPFVTEYIQNNWDTVELILAHKSFMEAT